MPRILLIDDHAMVREGFRRLLEETDGFEVVAEAGTPGEALAAARAHAPDLALVDLSLGAESSGLVLLLQLHESFPKMRCVVLSMHDDPALVLRALERGAQGFFTKAVAAEELLEGLRRIMQGERVLSSDLAPPNSHAPAARAHPARARNPARPALGVAAEGGGGGTGHQRQDALPAPRQPDGKTRRPASG